jgi:hypothetical protein
MSRRVSHWLTIGLVIVFVLSTGVALAAEWTHYPGSGSPIGGWPTDLQWLAISTLNDPDDGVGTTVEFVGDATYPTAYYYSNNNYLFVRMRIKFAGAVGASTFRDSHHIWVDQSPYDGQIDCGFAWDSKSNDITAHGLENMVLSSMGTTWGSVTMNDRDGDAGKKFAPPDFNTSGNGYIRTVDGQPFTGGVNTTFIDFAMSWSFLQSLHTDSQTMSCLAKGDRFKIQLASLPNATDHNAITINGDIAGGCNSSSNIGCWSSEIGSGPNAVTLKDYGASSRSLTGALVAINAAIILAFGGAWGRRHLRARG